MSIEKLTDSSKTIVEENPYVQILNEVTEFIKNNDAFRIWAFLLSKSRDWEVIKIYASKICGVGERKSEYVWSYLQRCGLMEYIKITDEKTGQYVRTDIKILNGTKFNKDIPFLNPNPKSTPAKAAALGKSTPAGTAAAETAAADMTPLLKKDIQNKDLNKNKDKSSSALRIEKQKEENKKKPAWAEPKAPLADVTSQTTSYDVERMNKTAPISQHLKKWMKENIDHETNKLLTRTKIQSKVPQRNEHGVQGAEIDAHGQVDSPSGFRGSDRLLEACGSRSHSETTGMAGLHNRSYPRME